MKYIYQILSYAVVIIITAIVVSNLKFAHNIDLEEQQHFALGFEQGMAVVPESDYSIVGVAGQPEDKPRYFAAH